MLAALNQLNRAFANAQSLDELAEHAASALFAVLPERGVLVQLWSHGDGNHLEAALGPEMSSALHSVELAVGDVRVGEITVDARTRSNAELSSDELEWIEAVECALTAAARERHSTSEQRSAQLSTVLALTGLLERRDSSLGRHFDRMRAHCRTVATGLLEKRIRGVDEEFIENLACASILHDIGKVAIPDSILLKSGRLSSGEWEITKTHTLLGAATLEDVIEAQGNHELLSLGRDIALQHHERWNGEGYPSGLRGEEISLAARIVAVVDVYDALTHHRPFRSAWSHEAAVEWIESRASEEFDPIVVECFLERANEIEAVSRRMPDPMLAEQDAESTR